MVDLIRIEPGLGDLIDALATTDPAMRATVGLTGCEVHLPDHPDQYTGDDLYLAVETLTDLGALHLAADVTEITIDAGPDITSTTITLHLTRGNKLRYQLTTRAADLTGILGHLVDRANTLLVADRLNLIHTPGTCMYVRCEHPPTPLRPWCDEHENATPDDQMHFYLRRALRAHATALHPVTRYRTCTTCTDRALPDRTVCETHITDCPTRTVKGDVCTRKASLSADTCTQHTPKGKRVPDDTITLGDGGPCLECGHQTATADAACWPCRRTHGMHLPGRFLTELLTNPDPTTTAGEFITRATGIAARHELTLPGPVVDDPTDDWDNALFDLLAG